MSDGRRRRSFIFADLSKNSRIQPNIWVYLHWSESDLPICRRIWAKLTEKESRSWLDLSEFEQIPSDLSKGRPRVAESELRNTRKSPDLGNFGIFFSICWSDWVARVLETKTRHSTRRSRVLEDRNRHQPPEVSDLAVMGRVWSVWPGLWVAWTALSTVQVKIYIIF